MSGQHTPWDDIEGHPYGKDYKARQRETVAPGERYAVVEGNDLDQLHRAVRRALQLGRAVRFTVDDGLKWDNGDGWTPSKGRPADETGH